MRRIPYATHTILIATYMKAKTRERKYQGEISTSKKGNRRIEEEE
jgi:hypothetical protein